MSSTDIDFGPDWIKKIKATPADVPGNVFSSQNSMTSSQHSQGGGGVGGLSNLMTQSFNNSQSPLLSNVERLMNEHRNPQQPQQMQQQVGGGNVLDSVFGNTKVKQQTVMKPFRPHLAKNRYGREDMLALYHSIVDDEGIIERPDGVDFEPDTDCNPCESWTIR